MKLNFYKNILSLSLLILSTCNSGMVEPHVVSSFDRKTMIYSALGITAIAGFSYLLYKVDQLHGQYHLLHKQYDAQNKELQTLKQQYTKVNTDLDVDKDTRQHQYDVTTEKIRTVANSTDKNFDILQNRIQWNKQAVDELRDCINSLDNKVENCYKRNQNSIDSLSKSADTQWQIIIDATKRQDKLINEQDGWVKVLYASSIKHERKLKKHKHRLDIHEKIGRHLLSHSVFKNYDYWPTQFSNRRCEEVVEL